MDSGTKRKRDLDCPRITFHAPGRVFDRLFREDSLTQLQEVVRKKLGLQPGALVKLAQIRGTADVDLEDEDDFDAFYNAVHSAFIASVRVTIQSDAVAKNAKKDESAAAPARKKRKLTTSQASATLPPSSPTEATPISTSVVPDKRAASPPSEVAKSSEDANEPPSKRVRISSPHPPAKPLEKQTPRARESAKRSEVSTNGKPTPETGTTVGTVSTSPPASTIVGKLGMDAKTVAKTKSRKSVAARSPTLDLKTRDEVLEEQAKAEKELKKKEKLLKKGSKKGGDNITTLASTTGGDGPVVASSKSKKSSTQSGAPKTVTSESGKPKKAGKQKAQVQEATSDSVDSETNDVLDVNVHHKEALANTSRSIIEKYLTLKPSTVEVGSKDSASTVQSIPTTLNCPYCGKGLTHDRSHCPLLRTKLVQTIEQRLEEVRANDNEDPEVRSNTISALEAALQRRRPATANKEQRMTISRPSVSPHPKSGSPIIVSTTTHVSESVSRSRSSTSSDSSSEDDSADEDVSPKNDSISRISVQQGISLGPSASTSRLLTSTSLHDDTDSEDSSEHDTSPPGAGIKSKSIPFRPQNDDSDTSSSSEDESEEIVASHSRIIPLLQPVQRSTLPAKIDGIGYNDKDLEALIRGPGVPFKSTDLPSSDSSEDEEPEIFQLEDESEQESKSRLHKAAPSFAIDSDSPDDDVEGDDENEREPSRRSSVTSAPPLVATSKGVASSPNSNPISEASQENGPFQQINGGTRSEEMDRSGNDVSEDVLPLENAPLGLVRKELTRPSATQKPSDPPVALTHPQSHDQPNEEPEPEKESTLHTNGTPPLDDMQEDPEREQPSAPSDLVGSTGASDVVPTAEPQSATEAAEDDAETPTPPPHSQANQPREEPARASTPKPAMIQRMRERAGKTPSSKKPAKLLSLNQAPVAKPSTRKTMLRAESKSTGRNQTIEVNQNNDDSDAEPVTPNVKASATKTPATRTKTTVEKRSDRAEGDKEPDPPPRRSQRTSSKPVSIAPEVVHANLRPLTRRTRATSVAPNSEKVIESLQPASKMPTKAVTRSKKAEAKVTPVRRIEDAVST
ncbi:hypothetical protein Agabi119p4_2025 [Agaricus bisporus var. burnettii]|uniref:Uncharacterized protein n=1 Tax=Agaricus bisporus var. burnettii TaxID=192524 RepID=A0A8H7F8N5_AGABI|nr:hypothetical protein Agabi119p4_2025 [Agaricus bisporus var. burnettii]